jgi:hypothetical protein
MRRLRLEDGAGVAAPLQLEAGAEAGQTRPENHHVHGARGLRDGAQVVEGGEPQRDAGGDAEAAEELTTGDRGDLGAGAVSSPSSSSRDTRAVSSVDLSDALWQDRRNVMPPVRPILRRRP